MRKSQENCLSSHISLDQLNQPTDKQTSQENCLSSHISLDQLNQPTDKQTVKCKTRIYKKQLKQKMKIERLIVSEE